MNFDMNMLSTLIRMMGQKPSPPREDVKRATTNFINENGIGQRIDLSRRSDMGGMASVLEMMSGKQPQKGDAASVLPMLMSMLSQSASDGKSSKDPSPRRDDAGTAKSECKCGQDREHQGCQCRESSGSHMNESSDLKMNASNDSHMNGRQGFQSAEAPRSAQSACHSPEKSGFSPISFAGYALISALNLLMTSREAE